jgi:hypothetical protein
MATTDTAPRTRTAPPAATALELALLDAAHKMRRARFGLPDTHVDLEVLADRVVEAAIRDQHQFVLCSAVDVANPTAEEHRWAQSLAGAVASRFQRTARRVLRSLKGDAPKAIIDDTTDGDGCPAWCVRYKSETGCDWCESTPIAFHGPGDMYDEKPEPVEVLWAAISEVPTEDVLNHGEDPTPYIYFDTLGAGQGSRMNVAETDAVIRRLSRYVGGLKVMRDQLAALTADQTA